VVVELLRLPAGPTQGIVGRWAVSSWIMRGDWLSATIEACPARNTAPLIERDVSRRSPGWCPVRRARPPARGSYPTPSAAVAVGLPAAFGRLHLDHSVPVAMGGANGAHPGCCTRRSATGARPSQEYTEQPDLHDVSGQARNTCEGA
jgi:hypothetical protein